MYEFYPFLGNELCFRRSIRYFESPKTDHQGNLCLSYEDDSQLKLYVSDLRCLRPQF